MNTHLPIHRFTEKRLIGSYTVFLILTDFLYYDSIYSIDNREGVHV